MSATSEYFVSLLQLLQRDDQPAQITGGGYSIYGKVLGFEGDDGMNNPLVVRLSEETNSTTVGSYLAIDRIVNITIYEQPAEPETEESDQPSV